MRFERRGHWTPGLRRTADILGGGDSQLICEGGPLCCAPTLGCFRKGRRVISGMRRAAAYCSFVPLLMGHRLLRHLCAAVCASTSAVHPIQC